MLRDQVPIDAKRRIKRAWWHLRTPTARFRALPDFIVFGAQKAGTTSLFNYLTDLSGVARPFGQEPVFFSHEKKFAAGVTEYRANFPLRAFLGKSNDRWPQRITGEASGEYLYYPTAPTRIAQMMPHVRLIVLLREPVDRAISHYFHNLKLGLEDLNIEDALSRELRWHNEGNPQTGPTHRQFGKLGANRAYLGRSKYAQHLERWFGVFEPSQILVLESESLFEQPFDVLTHTCKFLEVTPPSVDSYRAHNVGARSEISPKTVSRLAASLEEPNADLLRLLNRVYGADRPALRWLPQG